MTGGGIAVTQSYFYYTGDNNTVRYDMPGMINPVSYTRRDGIFSDLAGNGTLYTLWNGTSDPVGTFTSFNVTAIRTLNADLTLGATTIPLSQSFTMGSGTDAAIFAGYGFVILYTGGGSPANTFFKVDLPSGNVTNLGTGTLPNRMLTENWATWGVAEYNGSTYSVLYTDGTFPSTAIKRQVIGGTLTTAFSFTNLSDMACFTYAPWYNRWYWHHEGTSQFGGTDESAGYCNGSHTLVQLCGSSSTRVPVAVTVTPITVTATASPTTVCAGSAVTLTAGGATTYSWSTGGTNPTETVNPVTSQTYVVTGTNPNGCSNNATVSVSVNPLPTVTASAFDGTICVGSNDTLVTSGAVTYAWSSGGTSTQEVVAPTTTTTYTVTGTDALGCTNTATVTVNVNALPTVTAASVAGTVCFGTSDSLIAGGADTYVWSTTDVNDTIIVTPAVTSTYTVTGTDVNGCVNTATVTVNVNALPVVALGADTAQCEGTVTLDAQNTGATYAWSTGGSAQTETVSATGVYSVAVTDANGCVNSDTINVTINANPVVALGADSTRCGGTVMVDAGNPGSTYLWSDNSNAQTLVINATGTYYVEVTTAAGCVGSDTINVTINTIPTVTGTAASTTVCLDDADVALTGTPANGVWSGPGVTGNNFDPSVGAGAQNLVYSFTDANGCSSADTVTVTVNACVGFEEATLAAGVNLYPNPNNGAFTLAVNANVGDMVIEVMDMQGRLVFKSNENNVQTGFTKQITLENQASGMYMVRMTTANEMHIVKVSVQK